MINPLLCPMKHNRDKHTVRVAAAELYQFFAFLIIENQMPFVKNFSVLF